MAGDGVYHNGVRVRGRYGPNLDSLGVNHTVGVMVDRNNELHLYVNGVDQGVAAADIPHTCYAVVDLYGMCAEVSVVIDNGDDYDNQENQGDNKNKPVIEAEETSKDNKAPKNGMTLTKSVQEMTSSTVGTIAAHASLHLDNCQYRHLCHRFVSILSTSKPD